MKIKELIENYIDSAVSVMTIAGSNLKKKGQEKKAKPRKGPKMGIKTK